MNMTITPTKLTGYIMSPPSKSVAHRAIICASLTAGTSKINNIAYSDDIYATIEGMKALGATIRTNDDQLEITGIFHPDALTPKQPALIDCKESGSTLRFLIPIAVALEKAATFIGEGQLKNRPLTPYFPIFSENNIAHQGQADDSGFQIKGVFSAQTYEISGDISSQFITGLHFALPLLKTETSLHYTTPLTSKNYVDLTTQVMAHFGYEVQQLPSGVKFSPIPSGFTATDFTVEGDYSGAAFYLCAAALGHDIVVGGLAENSLQGDKAILDILVKMGAKIDKTEEGITLTAPKGLHGTRIDGTHIPDIIPILCVVASVATGTTTIKNVQRLRLKECDRLAATINELSKLGATLTYIDETLIIKGNPKGLSGGTTVASHKDHRIAMMLAIAGTLCKDPIIIEDSQCISKSYPNFFQQFNTIGGRAHVG